MNTLVVINEQHNLLDEQINLLNNYYAIKYWKRLDIPAKGLKAIEIKKLLDSLEGVDCLVFCSPVAYMIKVAILNNFEVLVFHNDGERKKKELPNGNIIFQVPQEGWRII
jgi:hypothetical protein